MISLMSNRSTPTPSPIIKAMMASVRAPMVAALLLLGGDISAQAAPAPASAFEQPRSVVESAIAAKLGCSWRPYLEASEQCGDELVVLGSGANGAIESVELTCALRPSSRSQATCRRSAAWLVDSFLPSWAGRKRWVDQVFRKPPHWGRWIKTKVGRATVLAQAEGPADLDLENIVIGITRGDSAAWDLPR